MHACMHAFMIIMMYTDQKERYPFTWNLWHWCQRACYHLSSNSVDICRTKYLSQW